VLGFIVGRNWNSLGLTALKANGGDLHLLVEAKIDGRGARHRLVTVVDVRAHLERGGDDANHDGSRDHQDGDR